MFIDDLKLFRGHDFKLNKHITIHHPTIDEICDYGEQEYWSLVSGFCATPSDCKVMLLDECGIDYEKISDFELWCIMIQGFDVNKTSILFGDLDFKLFQPMENKQNGELCLHDETNNITIDNTIYTLIVDYIRKLHGFEKNTDKPGNEHTKMYLIDKERSKLRLEKNKKWESSLVPLVSALTNCEQFKYNHDTVWGLPIYVFMDAVRRIQTNINYKLVMGGVYSGTVDMKGKKLPNWMGNMKD